MMNKSNLQKRLYAISAGLTSLLAWTTTAHATSGLSSSTVVTGTKSLISDLTAVLTGMSITIAVAVVIYCLIRKSMADEQDGRSWQKRAVTAGICGILGVLASGIISVIAGYYGA